MWVKSYPVKYAVPFREAEKDQFYLWFSPTQALVGLSSVELTAVWPIRTHTIVATHVTLHKLKMSSYPDMFFVGIGEKWVRYDGTVEVEGFKGSAEETRAATLKYLDFVANEPGESEFKAAAIDAMHYSDSSNGLEASE